MTRVAAAATGCSAVCAALLAAACAVPIHTELYAVDPPVTVRRIAVEPVEVDPMLGVGVPGDAAGFVTTKLRDALAEQSALRVVDGPGADASLGGELRRWSQRYGRSPSSVWLVLALRDRDGRLLWSGVYEETQPMLSDDLLSFSRAWERGFGWASAEELAEYGVRKLVDDLAREAPGWS